MFEAAEGGHRISKVAYTRREPEVRAGLLVRQMHHWAALIFVGAIVIHLVRIFLTAAYRRPREINWVIGLTLLIVSMIAGFVGYSVPDDLLSGTGLRIAYSIVLSVPVIGGSLGFFVFGSRRPTDVVIPRLYGGHILLLPTLIPAPLGAHLAILGRPFPSHSPGPGRPIPAPRFVSGGGPTTLPGWRPPGCRSRRRKSLRCRREPQVEPPCRRCRRSHRR